MTIEVLTLIFTIANWTVLAGLFFYLKFITEKQMRIYEHKVGDLPELHNKMHDRLEEALISIELNYPPDSETKKRFRLTATRCIKHDKTIYIEVINFLKDWESKTKPDNELVISVEKIKSKVDDLLK
jgi:hypothetical protein